MKHLAIFLQVRLVGYVSFFKALDEPLHCRIFSGSLLHHGQCHGIWHVVSDDLANTELIVYVDDHVLQLASTEFGEWPWMS